MFAFHAASQLDPALEAKVNTRKQSDVLEEEFEVSGGGSTGDGERRRRLDEILFFQRQSPVSSQEAAKPGRLKMQKLNLPDFQSDWKHLRQPESAQLLQLEVREILRIIEDDGLRKAQHSGLAFSQGGGFQRRCKYFKCPR